MNNFEESMEFIFNTKVYQKICTEGINGGFILSEANEIMRIFENKLNFYNKDSEISKINENAGKSFVKVSNTTFEIISKSKDYSEMTKGLFDITIAPLVKEWGINSENPRVLDEYKVKEMITLVNYEDIILDKYNLAVKLAKKNQKIDVGGIAKGYIADKLIEFYKLSNVSSAIINLGGNIKILGKKNETNLWNVGIYYPKKHSNTTICSIELEDKSIVTSGGYERAFMNNGEVYHHILNPATGCPAKTDLKSITIISDSSLEGDALSTPLFIMGKYKASDFMKKNKLSGIMVTEEDEIIISKDLISKFKLIDNYKVLAF